jgi:hypothetical protein
MRVGNNDQPDIGWGQTQVSQCLGNLLLISFCTRIDQEGLPLAYHKVGICPSQRNPNDLGLIPGFHFALCGAATLSVICQDHRLDLIVNFTMMIIQVRTTQESHKIMDVPQNMQPF